MMKVHFKDLEAFFYIEDISKQYSAYLAQKQT